VRRKKALDRMSFIHATIVGHFDPLTVQPRAMTPLRPIDPSRFEALLAEFGEGVARCVGLHDGYAYCEWAPGHAPAERVQEFAQRLAEAEGCLAMETPFCLITYPPAAVAVQAERIRLYQAESKHAEPGRVLSSGDS
jgi:hypothetical protein